MIYYMRYDEYVIRHVNNIIEVEGGLRKAAESLGMDPGHLSKIANGILLPRGETFNKLFKTNIKTETITYVVEEI